MRRLLVTGGAGFIGSHFAHYYRDAHPQDEILIVDKMGYASNEEAIKGFKIERGDLARRWDAWFPVWDFKPTHIVHFAAETHVDNSINDPTIFFRSNVLGTQQILEAARKDGKIERFIHISTDEVIDFDPVNLYTLGGAREDAPLRGSSPYAASKLGAEAVCHAYFKTYGYPVTVLRLCNTYGPRQHKEKLIPKAVSLLSKGSKVPLYGNGLQMRQWMHVADAVRGVETALLNPEVKAGEVYHISNYFRTQNCMLVQAIANAIGFKGIPYELVEDRPGHDLYYNLNSDKFRTLTGWKPLRKDMTKSLRELVNGRD